MKLSLLILLSYIGLATGAARGDEPDIPKLTAALRSVGPQGEGQDAAIRAWKDLAAADVGQLPEILRGMKGGNPLSDNWIRSAVETIVQRAEAQGDPLPIGQLEQFLGQAEQSPRGRRLAFDLIVQRKPDAYDRLVPTMLNDPSLELRREAVAMLLERVKAMQNNDRDQAVITLRRAFDSARDTDQIKQAVEGLQKLDQTVDIPRHMGFLMQWRTIGPFDNTGDQGFDVAYPPERGIAADASYDGKLGKVMWKPVSTEDSYGVVDLNQAVGKHKGAVQYFLAEFISDQDREVDIRLGCICGNKVWVNGELLMRNRVYHVNMQVDQYVAKTKLKKGRNQILVKVCQNEQTENWAQRWEFQLRVCDALGTAVLSVNRPNPNRL